VAVVVVAAVGLLSAPERQQIGAAQQWALRRRASAFREERRPLAAPESGRPHGWGLPCLRRPLASRPLGRALSLGTELQWDEQGQRFGDTRSWREAKQVALGGFESGASATESPARAGPLGTRLNLNMGGRKAQPIKHANELERANSVSPFEYRI